MEAEVRSEFFIHVSSLGEKLGGKYSEEEVAARLARIERAKEK
jgi:hypothetical protein